MAVSKVIPDSSCPYGGDGTGQDIPTATASLSFCNLMSVCVIRDNNKIGCLE